jgi:hypothetical protein
MDGGIESCVAFLGLPQPIIVHDQEVSPPSYYFTCPHHNIATWKDNGDVSHRKNELQMHAPLVGLSEI